MKNLYEKIYEAVKLIPCGKVSSYGEIARLVGHPRCARQVGWALHRNPQPGIIPCHRVVFADGSLSPAFAFGGANQQHELLANEGVTFTADNKVDMKKHFYKFI